jgi:hypothetical protein
VLSTEGIDNLSKTEPILSDCPESLRCVTQTKNEANVSRDDPRLAIYHHGPELVTVEDEGNKLGVHTKVLRGF